MLNRQTHAEASKILYSTYTFSFHTSIEAVVPFLSDLTPRSRANVRHLSLTKKALPYAKEFDRAEWANMCEYLACTPAITLRTLHLQIISGKPDTGYASIAPITPSDFTTMQNEWPGDTGGVDLEWAEQLMAIKGLHSINIKALVERCARPVSEKQAFWVAFSKSVVEGGFGDWVRGRMVE
jgi:hypothetical protein